MDVLDLVQKQNFTLSSWTPLKKPFSFHLYEDWIAQDFYGEMHYLKTHQEQKKEPQRLLPSAHSVLTVAHNYIPHPEPKEGFPLKENQVALYARGYDYHFWLKEKLDALITDLKNFFPDEEFIAFTDSSPVLEKDHAYQAGLGWIGKNTCLIHEKEGSLFVLGEIFTSLKLQPTLQPQLEEHPDRCGTCTRCLDICPTNAFIEPRKMDARKCISYLTIESKSDPAEELREKMGSWLFGCDLCQTVCPWNQKVFGKDIHSPPPQNRNELITELKWILSSSHRHLQKTFQGTALSRIGGRKLKRNTLIVAANLELSELIEEIQLCEKVEELQEVAKWSLSKLNNNK